MDGDWKCPYCGFRQELDPYNRALSEARKQGATVSTGGTVECQGCGRPVQAQNLVDGVAFSEGPLAMGCVFGFFMGAFVFLPTYLLASFRTAILAGAAVWLIFFGVGVWDRLFPIRIKKR